MFSIHVLCEYRLLKCMRQTARIRLVPPTGHEIAAVSRRNTEIGSLIATGHQLNLGAMVLYKNPGKRFARACTLNATNAPARRADTRQADD